MKENRMRLKLCFTNVDDDLAIDGLDLQTKEGHVLIEIIEKLDTLLLENKKEMDELKYKFTSCNDAYSECYAELKELKEAYNKLYIEHNPIKED